MKLQNLILMLGIVFALFSLSLVSATVTVNYNLSSAIIEDNDALNITGSTLLSGTTVNVVGYACANVACTSIGAQIPGLTASTNSGIMSVVYPNNLPASGRYVLYFYSNGYIGWEQIANWNSPDNRNYNVNSTTIIYLSKKRTGFAPIMNLSVVEEVPTGRPIRIGFNVSIDADTYAAIENNGVSNIPLNEDVQTLVTLEIRNAANALVYTNNTTVNIPYSSSVPVNFDYTGFANTGDYSVRILTDVTDAKILTSIRQQAQAGITAIPQNLTNYTYTLISNLNMAPALPVQGDNVVFSFNYLSGFIDDSDTLLSANTTLNMTIFRDNSQIWSNLVNLGASGNYAFNYTFANTGSYLIRVLGSPNDSRGNLTIPSSQEITFVISATPTNETIDDDDDEDHHHETPTRHSSVNKVNFEDELLFNNTRTIDLTPSEEKEFNYRAFLFWLLVLIVLLIAAIIAVYLIKKE